MTADIIVLGAGSAGLAAAVTAAREGARTILIERHGYAGGMGTASLVHTFCGLYRMGEGPATLANPGFPAEMADRMMAATGESGPVKMGRVWVLRQHPVDFVRISDALLRESGVEIRYHTEAISVSRVGSDWLLKTNCRGRREEIYGRAIIDASGDAVLAEMLGGETEQAAPSQLQRPAYVFGLQGFTEGEKGLTLAGRLVDGVRRGLLPKASMGLHFRESGRAGEMFGTIDLSADETGEYDPLDPNCLARLEQMGRDIAGAAIDFLRVEADGWSRCYISHWPVRAGVRESRRWRGAARLTETEVMNGSRHEDDIALASWPLEFRETNRGPKLRYPQDDRAAGIPLGCLVPEGLERVFTAGRCISCDHGAQASIRVMGTCFATGQAAGLGAVLAVRGAAVEGLRSELICRFGAWE